MNIRILLLGIVITFCSSATMAQESSKIGEFKGAMETEMPEWFKQSFLDLGEDVQEATDRGKRLMLFFHQRGCPYCNALVEKNLAEPDIYKTVRDKLDVVAINIWGDKEVVHVEGKDFTEKTLARALNVNYTPTLIFFNEQRKVALRLDGYYPPKRFRKALRYITEHKDKTTSYPDFLASLELPAGGGNLHEQAFFLDPPYRLARDSASLRPLAVLFERNGCAECSTLHEVTFADPATKKILEQFDIVQLDMQSDVEIITPAGEHLNARAWAKKLDIKFAPTIVLFDRAGREVMRLEALFKTFHIQSAFDYVLTESFIEQPDFQRYISDRADHLRKQGINVDIWSY